MRCSLIVTLFLLSFFQILCPTSANSNSNPNENEDEVVMSATSTTTMMTPSESGVFEIYNKDKNYNNKEKVALLPSIFYSEEPLKHTENNTTDNATKPKVEQVNDHSPVSETHHQNSTNTSTSTSTPSTTTIKGRGEGEAIGYMILVFLLFASCSLIYPNRLLIYVFLSEFWYRPQFVKMRKRMNRYFCCCCNKESSRYFSNQKILASPKTTSSLNDVLLDDYGRGSISTLNERLIQISV